ncbi:hypothetical protein ABMA46_07360 [Mesorhizobium sp. CN5-321]
MSKEKKSGSAGEKIFLHEPDCRSDDDVAFIKSAPAMELRRRYRAEANAHRNMLSRRTQGAVVHPDLHEFRSFLLLIQPMPGTGMTLDRINNDDPEYAPGKVRWADRHTQNNNKSDTLTFYYTRTGHVYTTSRLAKLQNVSPGAIRKRRREGWSDDEIIEGKRNSSSLMPLSEKKVTGPVVVSSRFPAGLYTAGQLALLARGEAQLTWIANIQFHRDAHHHQWYREVEGEEYMLPTYEELLEILEEHASRITREGHKCHFLRWWRTARPHVVYSNLRPDQREMVVEYDPEWAARQEAREKASLELTDAM